MWETDPLAFIACARKYWHKENTPHNLHFFPCVSPGPFSKHMHYKGAVPGLARGVLRDVTLWEPSSPGVTAATSTCPAAPTLWQPLLSPLPRSSQLPFLHTVPLLLQNTDLCLTEHPPISPVRCYGWTWGSHLSRSLWIVPQAVGGVILLCFKIFPANTGGVLHGGLSSSTAEELTQIFKPYKSHIKMFIKSRFLLTLTGYHSCHRHWCCNDGTSLVSIQSDWLPAYPTKTMRFRKITF